MKVMISGTAGFIGAHTAARFMADHHTVIGFDNLSRRGSTNNLEWLLSKDGDFKFARVDIRDNAEVTNLFASHPDVDAVIHLAGQVAVTTSVVDPRLDFE